MTVISILGQEHSGTTLLARVLNNHPSAIAIGGIKNIGRFVSGNLACSCGQSYGQCILWTAIEGAYNSSAHDTFSNIPKALTDSQRSAVRKLLLSVADASGKRVIIESSRNPSLLGLLPDESDFARVAVHIFKRPAAQAFSAHQGGRSIWREMKHYRRRSAAVLRSLNNHPAAIHIPHHEFCAAPAVYLGKVLGLAGLKTAANQLDTWGEKSLHMLGGNRMQASRSSCIRPDATWREGLPWRHRLTALLLGSSSYRRNLAAARPYLADGTAAR